MQEKKEYSIGYKVDCKHLYKVFKNEIDGVVYYKTLVKKKNSDGTETNYYKNLKFAKCSPPNNGEIIKIHYGFEDIYPNKKDKYNPVSVIVVLEYEKMFQKVDTKTKAFDEYKNIMENKNDDSEFDADLPF